MFGRASALDRKPLIAAPSPAAPPAASPVALPRPALAGAWLAVAAAAIALWGALRLFHGPLTRALTAQPTPAQRPLAVAVADMRPEPQELALYLVCLVVPPLVVWGLSLVAPRLPRPRGRVLSGAALLVQAATIAGVLRMWWYQNRKVHPFFGVERVTLGAAAVVAVALAGWAGSRWLARRGALDAGRPLARAWALLAAIGAAGYAILHLSTVVFDDASVRAASTTVNYHLPFTLGEFAAVLNGRTPGVDFFPQYAWFLPYPLAPLFRVIGLTVTSFTLTMAALSLVALMLVWDVLRRVTSSPWVALGLFVPLVALAFQPVEIVSGQPAHAFNYFAVGPLRYFGPFVVAWLVAWNLTRPSAQRAFLLFAGAGLSALNNLDFGVPALGGAMLALGLTSLAAPGPRARPLLRLVGAAAVGLAAAYAVFQAAAFLHSGHVVPLADMTVFQRAFVVLGFGMLPMPPWGMHWNLYLTFMLGLGTGVVRLAALRGRAAEVTAGAADAERLLCGVLIQGSVFGAGALTYYVGRSHWAVLPAIFAAWGVVLVLLAWIGLRGLAAVRHEPLRVLPAILALLALAVPAGEALPLGRPRSLVAAPTQLGVDTVNYVIEAPRYAELVRRVARPGEKVMISYPAGHLTASLAGVDDVFPFVEYGSCLVVGQVDEIVARMKANGVTKHFGTAGQELRARVAAEGLPILFYGWEPDAPLRP
jgi:hypothetical protein